MTMPRLVLVTRRFWPLVGGAEVVMGRLATAFHERGLATTLLTAQWQIDWPLEIEQHGVKVIRLPQSTRRVWGTWRYLCELAGWLRRHRAEFDLVYVSMLKHDAYAALAEGRRENFPVVLRAEGAGLSGDCFWQLEARFGRRIKRRCMTAQELVAPSPAVERELIAAGYPRDRIQYIPNGVPIYEPRTPTSRAGARLALGDIDPAWQLQDASHLALYTGRLHPGKGLAHLIDAWKAVMSRWPKAKLLIVGEGPEHDRLAAQVEHLGLTRGIILAGAFDDIEDFLAAADLFVLPSLEEGMSLALLEAMAMGLPVIATRIPANEVLVRDGAQGLLVPTADAPSLARAILSVWDLPDRGARLGLQGYKRVRAEFSLSRMVDRHLELFDRVLAGSR